MKNLLVPFLAMIFCSSTTIGQSEVPKKVHRVRITDVSLQTGFFKLREYDGDLNAFRAIYPGSQILSQDFTGYRILESGEYEYYNRSKLMKFLFFDRIFTLYAGLQFGNKKKNEYNKNFQLRLGLGAGPGPDINLTLYKDDRYRIDTLNAGQLGTLYVDTMIDNFLYVSYYSNQVRFDASFSYTSDPYARLSVRGGLGLTFGCAKPHTLLQTTDQYYRTIYSDSTYIFFPYQSTNDMAFEYPRPKINYEFLFYVPVELSLRFAKTCSFWKYISLYTALKPGFYMVHIPDWKNFSGMELQGALGLRFAWN